MDVEIGIRNDWKYFNRLKIIYGEWGEREAGG